MKSSTKISFLILCLISAHFSIGAFVSNAQDKGTENPKTVKNILVDIVRTKNKNTPFIMETPQDLAKILLEKSSGTAEAASADPCDTASPIDIGQTIGNALNNTDCRLDDGSYADFYIFEGNQGQQVTIYLSSSSFDPYLGLANTAGTFTVEDDDSGGGWNARITATLPETGTYVILANSLLPSQFGGYTLSLGGAAPCTFSVSPTSAQIPATGGTFSFNVNTQAECYWKAFSVDSYVTTSSSGRGPGTVTYTVSQNGSGSIRTGGVTISTAPLITQYYPFTITQPSVACNYSLNPSSVNIPPTQTTGSFQIIAPAGCPWTVSSNSAFVTANDSGTGTATISYNAMHNNGAPRVMTISIGSLTFTINQAGLNCVFTVTPTQMNVGSRESIKIAKVDVQPGCVWSVTRNMTWIELLNTSGGTGPGTITFKVGALTDSQTRSGVVQIFYSTTSGTDSTSVWIDQSVKFNNSAFDYDGDGKADISVFRPSNGGWYRVNSSNNSFSGLNFGLLNDIITPADFDGDGKTDIAVFRKGFWYRINSSTNQFVATHFGQAGDVPVAGDFDGDGRADIAVYRPSNGFWYRINSSNEQFFALQFGTIEDKPQVADFDGDGKSDIAVYRPSNGGWYRINSSNNSFFGANFGIAEDIPTAADYDADGKADISVFRPSAGAWYRLNSSNNQFFGQQFGISEDKPVAADYDGDGKTDIAVFRPSAGSWYIHRSGSGFFAQQFGTNGDIPTPSVFRQ